jgi:hypothetical protein
MKLLRTTLLGALLAASIGPAAAFQEQGTAAAPATPATEPRAAINVPNQPIRGTGAEIRVPGLGQIGTLPKFDFGLELLYGAGEPKGLREELNKNDPNDLQIRGTIKYRFNNN